MLRYRLRKRPSGVVVGDASTLYGALSLARSLRRQLHKRRLELARATRRLERRRQLEGEEFASDDDLDLEDLERRHRRLEHRTDTETAALDVYRARAGEVVEVLPVGDAEPQLPRPPTPPRSRWEQLANRYARPRGRP